MADAKIKLQKEEVEQVKAIQQNYNELLLKFGQLGFDKTRLKEFEESLESEYKKHMVKENEYMQELNKKYGDGFLDTNTMEFTPKEK